MKQDRYSRFSEFYSDQPLDKEIIRTFLKELFPSLEFFFFDPYRQDGSVGMPVGFDQGSDHHIVFHISTDSDKKEWGTKLSIYGMPHDAMFEREQYIGGLLAVELNTRVLIPFSDPYSPYMNIIFEGGGAYLADDSDTNFADGTDGSVQVISDHSTGQYKFDAHGYLISAAGINSKSTTNGK